MLDLSRWLQSFLQWHDVSKAGVTNLPETVAVKSGLSTSAAVKLDKIGVFFAKDDRYSNNEIKIYLWWTNCEEKLIVFKTHRSIAIPCSGSGRGQAYRHLLECQY